MKAVFDKFISSTVVSDSMYMLTICNSLNDGMKEGSKKFAELSGKLGGNIKKQVKQVRYIHNCVCYVMVYYSHLQQARIVMKKKHKPQVRIDATCISLQNLIIYYSNTRTSIMITTVDSSSSTIQTQEHSLYP